MHWTPRVPMVICVAFVCLAAPALAQPAAVASSGEARPWALFDAIGYGGLGFLGGLMMAIALPSEEFGPSAAGGVALLAGTAGGTIAGAVIGHRASAQVSAGKRPDSGHSVAVAIGFVASGATIGALASVPLINTEQSGTPLGSDERTFGILAVSGSVLGLLYAKSQWDVLSGRRLHLGIIPGLSEVKVRVALR